MSGQPAAETVTVTHDGRQYKITRCAGSRRTTVVERWPGLGVIGSDRRFIAGAYFAKHPAWWGRAQPDRPVGGRSPTSSG